MKKWAGTIGSKNPHTQRGNGQLGCGAVVCRCCSSSGSLCRDLCFTLRVSQGASGQGVQLRTNRRPRGRLLQRCDLGSRAQSSGSAADLPCVPCVLAVQCFQRSAVQWGHRGAGPTVTEAASQQGTLPQSTGPVVGGLQRSRWAPYPSPPQSALE